MGLPELSVSPQTALETLRTAALTTLPFLDAGTAWLETRRPYLSPKTIHEYELNLKTLSTSFGEMRLTEISPDQIRAYQRMRMATCGPSGINHETSVLQQMLKRIGRWPELAADFQPLPLPKHEIGRALREEERKRLLEAGRDNPNWMAAYVAVMLSINTTAGPKELCTLRLKDVDLAKRTMMVQPQGSKNVHRTRVIPLNDEALAAAKLAIDRAKLLGSTEADHYLFPYRIPGGNLYESEYVPTKHQTTFKTAWTKLRTAAKVNNFRLYDCRHHAITVLLENPKCSEETAEAIAGHISRKMKKRYSHVRMEARRTAVQALSRQCKRIGVTRKGPKSTGSTDVAKQLVTLLSKLLKTS